MTKKTASNSMPQEIQSPPAKIVNRVEEFGVALDHIESLCRDTLGGLSSLLSVIHEDVADGKVGRARTLVLLAMDYAELTAEKYIAYTDAITLAEEAHHG